MAVKSWGVLTRTRMDMMFSDALQPYMSLDSGDRGLFVIISSSYGYDPAKVSTFLTSTNAALVELGTIRIRQGTTIGHALRKCMRKDPIVDNIFHAEFGA